MIAICIVTTVVAALWTFVVLFAIGIDDNSGNNMAPLAGGLSVLGAWLIVSATWLAWYFG